MSTISTESQPLLARFPSAPGRGFKARIDGKWQDYAPQCNQFLLEAYAAGCPSMRLNVKGQMYKFDLEKMEQINLNTLAVNKLRAPDNAERPQKSSVFLLENLRHPRSKGRKSLQEKIRPQRPVFIVRVPPNGPGTTIRAPHPKKLGKAMPIAVPADAKVGQALYLPMPKTRMKTKVKYAAGGTALGTTGAAVGIALMEATSITSAGGVAAGGALATVGTVAAVSLGGVAVVGAVVAAGVGVHYATRNPGKAVAIGALAIGALALADHVADTGVVEAASDAAEVAGDVVEGVVDFAEDAADTCEDAGDFIVDAGDWLGDVAEDGVDFMLDLF